LSAYNAYFHPDATQADIHYAFSGVRPLAKSKDNASLASREYVLETKERLITVFGGKWTTARALARNVLKRAEGK